MILSKSFFYTLREDAKDEESKSGNLLVRGGYIKKSSAGVYMIMPLGFRVLRNIENIIREEMEKINTQEMTMPTLIPEEVFEASGRKNIIGQSMFQLNDRYDRPYVLGPTHEELFANAAKMMISSYKDMPVKLYQFQTKFRDEARPRYGLIRVREFVMKDAYSFDTTLETMDESYALMRQAYNNIFDRLKMDYRIVKADTGIMGGLLSEEYQAVTDIGEDILVLNTENTFSSNLEVAENVAIIPCNETQEDSYTKIETPNIKTIEEVVSFLNVPTEKLVKTLIYDVDDKHVAVCVSGSREVNEVKLRKLLNAEEVILTNPGKVYELLNTSVGFVGPINNPLEIIIDNNIKELKNFVVGASEDDYHLINVNFKDITSPTTFADISNVKEGDPSPDGKGTLVFSKGIEVGNIFKLGTAYSKAMGLTYANESNKLEEVYMASYGIGVGRVMAAIAEQTSDDLGLNWPLNIAPYSIAIVVVNPKDETQNSYGLDLYNQLQEKSIDVILDDRNTRPGVKFKDIELIGIPYQITVGRDLAEGYVEFKKRGEEPTKIHINEIKDHVISLIK